LKKRKDVGIISDQHASIVSLEILKTPSSLYVFSGAEDGSFNLWKGSDWSKLFSFKGHTASILSIAVHYSGRTALTVAGSPENSLRLWDLMRGTCAMSQRFPSGSA
jgi:WD40 repeat protein